MHECYAMQILVTKTKQNKKQKNKTKQRTMITKGKAKKHKVQKSQDRSGTQNHTNYLMKCLKLTSIKRFSEDIGILPFSGNILKTYNLSFKIGRASCRERVFALV